MALKYLFLLTWFVCTGPIGLPGPGVTYLSCTEEHNETFTSMQDCNNRLIEISTRGIGGECETVPND